MKKGYGHGKRGRLKRSCPLKSHSRVHVPVGPRTSRTRVALRGSTRSAPSFLHSMASNPPLSPKGAPQSLSPPSTAQSPPSSAETEEKKVNGEGAQKQHPAEEQEEDNGEEDDEEEDIEGEESDDLSDEEEPSKEALETAAATRASIEQFYKNFFKSVKERENRYQCLHSHIILL